jgi:hypothetical protein
VLAEYDTRVADVGLISRARYQCTDLEDNLRGAPDLTIEAKWPMHGVLKLHPALLPFAAFGSDSLPVDEIFSESSRR